MCVHVQTECMRHLLFLMFFVVPFLMCQRATTLAPETSSHAMCHSASQIICLLILKLLENLRHYGGHFLLDLASQSGGGVGGVETSDTSAGGTVRASDCPVIGNSLMPSSTQTR